MTSRSDIVEAAQDCAYLYSALGMIENGATWEEAMRFAALALSRAHARNTLVLIEAAKLEPPKPIVISREGGVDDIPF